MGKTVRYTLVLNNPPPLTRELKKTLAALAARPDSEIDTSDIPPLDKKFWKVRSAILYKPTKT